MSEAWEKDCKKRLGDEHSLLVGKISRLEIYVRGMRINSDEITLALLQLRSMKGYRDILHQRIRQLQNKS